MFGCEGNVHLKARLAGDIARRSHVIRHLRPHTRHLNIKQLLHIPCRLLGEEVCNDEIRPRRGILTELAQLRVGARPEGVEHALGRHHGLHGVGGPPEAHALVVGVGLALDDAGAGGVDGLDEGVVARP